jgi:hypothetical protein
MSIKSLSVTGPEADCRVSDSVMRKADIRAPTAESAIPDIAAAQTIKRPT